MGITRISILRPLFITMVFSAIVVLGLISYGRLGVDLFPSVNVPVVSVFVPYPGANPESIEALVTKPIEDSLAGLSDIEYMRSISSEGQSTVLLAFNDRTNPDSAAIDVERKINGIRSRLPGDTLPPNIVKADVNSLPVLDISFSGSLSNEELFRLVNDLVVPRMQSVPGVAAVDVIGGQESEIRVTVDQQKLQAHRLSILQVVAALQQDNLNVPSGSLIEAGKEFGVRVNTLVPAPGFLENIVIASTPTGSVRLRDVAKVEETLKRRVHINRTNLTDSIAIEITKQATANTLQVTDEIKAEIDQLQAELPAGVQMDIVVDASVFTRQSLNDVQNTLIEAIILTGLVLLLFLHAWRSTVIVLLAIPTSLIATFAAMFFFRIHSEHHVDDGTDPCGRNTRRRLDSNPGKHHSPFETRRDSVHSGSERSGRDRIGSDSDHISRRGSVRTGGIHVRHRRSVLSSIWHCCSHGSIIFVIRIVYADADARLSMVVRR